MTAQSQPTNTFAATILVVDDIQENLTVLAEMLQPERIRLGWFHDGSIGIVAFIEATYQNALSAKLGITMHAITAS